VRALTDTDASGNWHLPADSTVANLVGICTEDGIAAVSASAPGTTLVLPERLTCEFDFESAAPYSQIWLDPLELDQFPHTLMPALHAGPGGSILLHVASFEATGALVLALQRGRYRLSGGRIAIHPAVETGSEGLTIGEASDVARGPLARHDGDWLLIVDRKARYRIRFEVA
jgi:hypothetical protein